jgi:hypothetical protein
MEKKADYQISSSVKEGILEFILTGNAIGSAFEKMLNDVDTIIKANSAKKAIFDIRALEGRIERTEIYRFVRNQHFIIYEVESAIVDLPENASYGTAVKDAGLPWKWFTDIDAARDWLKSKQSK